MSKIKIGITQGDINGVGYEVILKTFSEPHLMELCIPVLYGSQKLAQAHKQKLTDIQVNMQVIADANMAQERKLNIISCTDDKVTVNFGKGSEESAKAALDSLERACNDLREGQIDALVTAPISKGHMQEDKFGHKGHTEYLAQQFGVNEDDALMLLMTPYMRVALATNHLAMKDVANHLSKELIVKKLNILNQCLKSDLGIRRPRIAVLALNPHSGDNGILGHEEEEIIIPAIEEAESNHEVLAIGPYAADGFFGNGTYRSFDAILAMYHDQGLIPLKMTGMSNGVNFTAGLPFVRTSPDHGTAFDIAGTNMADPTSFREAVYAAVDIYMHRKSYEELNAHPLVIKQKQTNNKE